MGFFSATDLLGIPFPVCGFGKVSGATRLEFSALLQSGSSGFEPALFGEDIFTCLVGPVVFGDIALRGDFVGGGDFGGGKEPWASPFRGLPLCLVGVWADVDWGTYHGGGYWDSFRVGGGGITAGGPRARGKALNWTVGTIVPTYF